jgi:ribosomal protein S25
VRPFIVTGGRTRPLRDGLRIESLVLATERASTVPLRFEQRRLVELAQRAVSLAELAARLAVPIGVARVLVSDLHQEELIKIVEPHELPRDVIERIRDLVKAL